MAEKLHKYPQTRNIIKPIAKEVIGGYKKHTTDAGPHLLQGKGTAYNQSKITSGFILQDSRPGHKQEKNIKP